MTSTPGATSGGLYLQAASRSGQRADLPAAPRTEYGPGRQGARLGHINWITTTRGSRLLVNQESPCAGTDSLLWFSPATGRAQWLIKAPRGRAGVIGFVPYGPPDADIIIFVACPAGRPHAERPGLSSPGAVEVAPGLPRT